MGIRSVRPHRRLAAMGFAVCAACAPSVNAPSTPQLQTDMMASAREALSRLDRMTPEPAACGTGWAESPAGYVVAVAEWAEQAGLRPGDRIVAVDGTPVTGADERVRAYSEVPAGRPFPLGVMRRGQRVTLSMPCRHQSDVFRAERRTLEAAARGDWDGCIAAAREARQLTGFTAYLTLVREHACVRAKNPSMASPEGRDFAALHHELNRMLLRESRHVPGGIANVRETVLKGASNLRQLGFSAFADDLETQLQAALAAMPRLQLTWADNSTNEDGFSVERKIGETGTYLHLVTLPPNTTTYVDTFVQEDVIYCYRVRAFKASISSDAIDEACAMPKPSNPPNDGGGGR